jgi:hypothetical protein
MENIKKIKLKIKFKVNIEKKLWFIFKKIKNLLKFL